MAITFVGRHMPKRNWNKRLAFWSKIGLNFFKLSLRICVQVRPAVRSSGGG